MDCDETQHEVVRKERHPNAAKQVNVNNGHISEVPVPAVMEFY